MSRNRKREERLVRQWIEQGDLAPESVEQQEDSVNVPADRDKVKQRLVVLYILLGFSIVLMVVGLVLLVLQPH